MKHSIYILLMIMIVTIVFLILLLKGSKSNTFCVSIYFVHADEKIEKVVVKMSKAKFLSR